jgi:hypothetical protein
MGPTTFRYAKRASDAFRWLTLHLPSAYLPIQACPTSDCIVTVCVCCVERHHLPAPARPGRHLQPHLCLLHRTDRRTGTGTHSIKAHTYMGYIIIWVCICREFGLDRGCVGSASIEPCVCCCVPSCDCVDRTPWRQASSGTSPDPNIIIYSHIL